MLLPLIFGHSPRKGAARSDRRERPAKVTSAVTRPGGYSQGSFDSYRFYRWGVESSLRRRCMGLVALGVLANVNPKSASDAGQS